MAMELLTLINPDIYTNSSYNRGRIYHINVIDGPGPAGNGHIDKMWGSTRPGTADFLRFASRYFRTISVWSAGVYRYVHAICDSIFPIGIRPTIIFTSEDCIFGQNGSITKPLSKLWPRLPDAGPHNTLVIDDRSDTFIRNIDNGIHIPPYAPRIDQIFNPESILPIIQKWLMQPEVLSASDIRWVRKDIFSNSNGTE